jgi:hypothetical protein
MSGELPSTYLPLYISYSLSLSLYLPLPILSFSILHLTGSISSHCDHYGHSHVM